MTHSLLPPSLFSRYVTNEDPGGTHMRQVFKNRPS
jgi:hypothetical protein